MQRDMRPANERQHYNVTSSLIGWAHTQNDPWCVNTGVFFMNESWSPNCLLQNYNIDKMRTEDCNRTPLLWPSYLCLDLPQVSNWEQKYTTERSTHHKLLSPYESVESFHHTFENNLLPNHYIDGLVQERHNSIANTLQLCLSCINPLICTCTD